ncbi:MAG: GNAT family N-acetyltransferase [Vicingaceae bacterium]|nr:GNAT family N-acetyltransferase [Vicingaceae bacterium]
MLANQKIFLREVILTDVPILLDWENDVENWEVSSTTAPFSKEEIVFFAASNQHIFTHSQMRFMICLEGNHKPIGCIDLFDYDAELKKAGVGILIGEKELRNKGFATQALNLLLQLSFNKFNLVTVFAEIDKNNSSSICLFEKCNFKFVKDNFRNEKIMRYYEIKCNK